MDLDDANFKHKDFQPLKDVICDDSLASTISDTQTLNEEKKEIDKNIEFYKAQIADFMGDAESLSNIDGEKIATWKYSKPKKSLDISRLKEEAPLVYKQFLKTSDPVRTFKFC
jgi:hypothetical protein